jgi:transposase
MQGAKILMSQQQLQRYRIMGLVESGKLTLREAAEKMGLSYRQAKRICKRVREKGAQGLLHGNAGRSPQHRISEEVRQKLLTLSRETYSEFNDRHFCEQLREREGIFVGRETVRKLRRETGILPKRKRRPPRHRKRRPRRPQEGCMVIWDGSPHRWFGPNHPPCCLMLAMDDATGAVLAARFFSFEGTEGYLWLLREVVTHYGIPLSIYQDRHGTLKRNDSHWTLDEELAGRQDPTQVGQALYALGIQPIFALSAQAKGRIERAFNTLQDRLVAELMRAGIASIESANPFLKRYLTPHNRRFAVRAEKTEKAWLPVPEGLDVARVISFYYRAKVALDNTVRLHGLAFDIPPGPQGRSYAHAQVEARQLLDGSWKIYYHDRLIAKHGSTALHEPIRALPRNRSKQKSEWWVYQSSAQPIYDPPFR